MRCDFGAAVDDILRDQLVVSIFLEDIRRRLLTDDKLTLQRSIDLVNIEEDMERDSTLFHRLRPQFERSLQIEAIQQLL